MPNAPVIGHPSFSKSRASLPLSRTRGAGGHHERADGKGYPRGLTREQMSPAHMIAIADGFEGLATADRQDHDGVARDPRPDEAVGTCGSRPIRVVLRERIWLDSAHKFLAAGSVDVVDLSRVPGSPVA
jgi:hypothetical protein